MEKKYNKYSSSRSSASEILHGLRNFKEESIVDKVTEVKMEMGSEESTYGVLRDLKDLLKASLPKDLVEVFMDPIIERGDILVIQYAGKTFEVLPK